MTKIELLVVLPPRLGRTQPFRQKMYWASTDLVVVLSSKKRADAVQCEWFGRSGLANARHPDWPGAVWQSDWLGARACVLARIIRRAADVSMSAQSDQYYTLEKR